MADELLSDTQLEARRVIAIFDRVCRQAGLVVEQSRSDDSVMADVIRGQKGHPITVEQLIAQFIPIAQRAKRPASVARLFAVIPELLELEIEKRQLRVDPMVQSVLDGVPLSPFDAQRWFLGATYDEHGKAMRITFPHEYCCRSARARFERVLYEVARRRGFHEIKFEVARV